MHLHCYQVILLRAIEQLKPSWAVKRFVPGNGCPSQIQLAETELYSTTGDV